MDEGRRPSRPCPWHDASLLSTLVFGWTWKLFREGYRKDYSSKDLFVTPREDQSQILGDRLEKAWLRQVEVATRAKRTPSLKWAIIRAFAVDYIKLGGLILVHGLLTGVVSPLLLGRLLDYFAHPQQGRKAIAYWCASGIAVTSGVNALLFNHFSLGAGRLGMRVRTACCSLLYRKALRLSQSAQSVGGRLVNLVSNDVSRFEKVSVVLHSLWLSPLLAGVAAGFMFQEVGCWPSLAGLAALVALLPIQGYMSQLNAKYRSQTAYRSDARIRLVDDVVSGIRAIKMYAWEVPFQYLVRVARRKELDVLTLASYIRGVYMTLTLCGTRTAFFCSLVTMALLHERLTARKVFVLQSYFNVLSDAISMNLVRGMAEVAEVLVSISRLQDFMLLPEVMDYSPKKISWLLRISPEKESVMKPTYAVMMKGVTATWDPQYTEATLNDINLCIKEGYLSVVVGAVGSGKSSLLQAVLGELPAAEGCVRVRGSLSLASQEPWLFAATVRQNILFGQPFERARYQQVVRACVLDEDFARLPKGDLTEVGDQGVALSGGQKARINLARAIYKKADIYLLDDPLAALDSNVAQDLFDKCVCKFLENKTRILVTNHLQYVQEPDLIVMMNDSRAVVVEGDFRNVAFLNSRKRRLASSASESPDLQSRPLPPEPPMSAVEGDGEGEDVEDSGGLEASSKGRIGGKSVVGEYLRSGSSLCLDALILLLFLVTQLLVSAVDYFVSLWTTQEELKERNHFKEKRERDAFTSSLNASLNSFPQEGAVLLDLQSSVIIYSSLIIALFFFALVRSLIFFKVCMICSTKLHDTMFKSVIRAKVFFFDKNPTGRILNRFSKDMGAIDETLPRTLLNAKQTLMQMLGCIIVSVIVNYYFLVPILLIGAVFCFSRHVYLATSNNMKRVEGMAKSPVFSHFHATLRGLPTIRANGAQGVLALEFDHHQDLHTSAWFTFLSTSTAFGFFLDLFVSLFIAVVAVGSLLFRGRIVGVLGGHPGLAITQSMSLSGMLQWGVRESAEVSNNLMSVERVVEYTCLQPEEEAEQEQDQQEGSSTGKEWPESGKIEFVNVSVRYNPRDPPVIRNVNLVITPGQKVGVVGRTGAGKSSLLSALFRLCWSVEGRVLLDGRDTGAVPLEELRLRMSVIPQEPLMFAGTLRHNLDPFAQHPDSQLIKALQEVELKHALHDTQGLNTRVAEGGRNFSAGQRQLVCLARAVIRESKILVMDEATANVDEDTDTLIQRTIRIKFKHCTVLTVAHRLESVIDYDKILVVEAGEVVEFDHPHLLLHNPEGHFCRMVKENCSNVANRLIRKARESYENKGFR